jgi:hypothetical protein
MELKQETKHFLISFAPMRYKAHTKMFKRMRLISSKYVKIKTLKTMNDYFINKSSPKKIKTGSNFLTQICGFSK